MICANVGALVEGDEIQVTYGKMITWAIMGGHEHQQGVWMGRIIEEPKHEQSAAHSIKTCVLK